ncbi:NADPH-dependent FMN reductase [Cohnella caldifontis]|uniref:NADPH-dependent FMN reductase n=1 Tax=Cohnella caldifontis TaxID=3027471 RepID=UPI0023EE1FF1|nr:NADPH-dependent FMN reductase [Cohnella sp. YIM B05605]
MDHGKKVVLAVSGSLRELSSHTLLLESLRDWIEESAEYRRYDRSARSSTSPTARAGIQELPHFNPDLDQDEEAVHEAVREWREALREADAVVICTPEYARGVPGSLKNALDWIVSSGELVNKPVAAISASPHPEGGATALASLIGTLGMMNAKIPEQGTLAIPFFNSGKLGPDGKVTDPEIRSELESVAKALLAAVRGAV